MNNMAIVVVVTCASFTRVSLFTTGLASNATSNDVMLIPVKTSRKASFSDLRRIDFVVQIIVPANRATQQKHKENAALLNCSFFAKSIAACPIYVDITARIRVSGNANSYTISFTSVIAPIANVLANVVAKTPCSPCTSGFPIHFNTATVVAMAAKIPGRDKQYLNLFPKNDLEHSIEVTIALATTAFAVMMAVSWSRHIVTDVLFSVSDFPVTTVLYTG